MKTLATFVIAGALSATGAFAEATVTSPNVTRNDNTIATPRLPFRPVPKRPAGPRQASVAEPRVNVASPRLPFRPYPKVPLAAPANKPSTH